MGYLRKLLTDSVAQADTGSRIVTLRPNELEEIKRIVEIEEWSRANFL